MRAALLAAATLLCACDPAPSDSGATALLSVAGARFHPGPPPGDSGGPAVTAIDNPQFAVWRGQINKPFGGALGHSATAALLFLDGDRGYWIVDAGPADITAPTDPTFAVTLDFSAVVPLGQRALEVRAVDAAGRVGPARAEPLTLYQLPPPDGALVVTLAWDTEADLDLHVVTPAGVELWAHHAFESDAPAGEPPGPTVGYLDVDSNAGCLIDGRRQESVLWKQGPSRGHYLVRVDTASLCAARLASWSLTARHDGAVVGAAVGQSDESSTRASGARGSGVLALEFDVP